MIALVLEIGNYVFRYDLSDAFHANQLVVRCFAQSLHTAEVAGNGFGHHLAHEADAQCIEYSVERHFLATLNTIKHLLRHTFPASFNRKELVERQAVQIGGIVVGKQAALVEIVHGFGADAFYVHGLSADEVLHPTLQLWRTRAGVRTIMRRLALVAYKRCATFWTGLDEYHSLSRGRIAPLCGHADNLRNNFARFLHIHPVAHVQVQLLHDVGIVEGGAAHHGSRKLHGLHIGHGRHSASASYLKSHFLQSCASALGLEFIGDGPARALRCQAEDFLLMYVVHLQHYPIRSYGQVLALLVPIINKGIDLLQAMCQAHGFADLEPPAARLL